MANKTLALSDYLENGKTYTFVFNATVLGFGAVGQADVIASLVSQFPELKGVQVNKPSINPLSGELWITFTFDGPSNYENVDGWQTALAEMIKANFNDAAVDFVRADAGYSGAQVDPSTATQCQHSILGTCLDDTFSLFKWGVVGLGLLAVIVVVVKVA